MKKRERRKKTVDDKQKQRRSYMLRKRIAAGLFLLALYGYAAVNAAYGYHEWLGEWLAGFGEDAEKKIVLKEVPEETAKIVQDLEDHLVKEMYGRMNFIEIYSYAQVLLDKREINNFSYISDEDGYLHYASFFRENTEDMEEYAKRVRRLQDCAKSNGARVLFFVTPGKYLRGVTVFRTGMPIYDPNPAVDEIYFYLNRYGVETIDYRKYIPNDDLAIQDAFFRTDHHWTVPAAFAATQVLVEQMNERFDAGFDPDGFYMDPANYERVTYKKGMLGSMGRRTGVNFCKFENFETLWPKYDIQCTRESVTERGERVSYTGGITETLMVPDILFRDENVYSNSQYSLYMNTIRPYEKIVNLDNPEGCKLLIVRDSYFSPMMVFMAPMCGEIEAVWALEELEDLDVEQMVRENEYDYIVIELYPYNINDNAFNFFEENT